MANVTKHMKLQQILLSLRVTLLFYIYIYDFLNDDIGSFGNVSIYIRSEAGRVGEPSSTTRFFLINWTSVHQVTAIKVTIKYFFLTVINCYSEIRYNKYVTYFLRLQLSAQSVPSWQQCSRELVTSLWSKQSFEAFES